MNSSGLENAKKLVSQYKLGEIRAMTPELWQAKKVVDSTLHPGTARLKHGAIEGSVTHHFELQIPASQSSSLFECPAS